MTEDDTQKNTQDTAAPEAATEKKVSDAAAAAQVKPAAPAKDGAARPPRQKNPRRARKGPRRTGVRSEFDQKIVNIRRVTRVVAGGRRFSFSVAIILGNRKGSVGVGLGKASDTALAIEKASRNAKKGMFKVPLTKEAASDPGRSGSSIPHDVSAKYCASVVTLRPAPGKGLTAGSSVRTVLELAGINDVSAKVLSRSKNQLNNARAAIKALKTLNVERRT